MRVLFSVLASLLILVTTPSLAATKKHKYTSSYFGAPKECVEAWRVKGLDEAGPTGYCVPPHIRRDGILVRALAPYGSTTAGEFYEELDRWSGGATVE